MNQFVEEQYFDSYQCTIGVDYKTVYVTILDKLIKFLIWPESCLKFLVGNKCDFDNQTNSLVNQINKKKEVSFEEASEFSKLYGFVGYYETSAKTNKGIEKCFMEIGEYYVKNNYPDKLILANNEINKSVKLNDSSKKTFFNFNKCYC